MPLPTATRLITDEPLIDVLSTAVAWADAEGVILGVNPAFARWMGVSARRLLGQPLAALEMDGDAMARLFQNTLLQDTDRDVLRLHRMALGLPGETQRFAEGWLSRLEDGGWLLEAHPVDEFPARIRPRSAQRTERGAERAGP